MFLLIYLQQFSLRNTLIMLTVYLVANFRCVSVAVHSLEGTLLFVFVIHFTTCIAGIYSTNVRAADELEKFRYEVVVA
jgi:hypothetical protein